MTTSALEEAVSGFDIIDLEQVLAMERIRAQRILSRWPAPTAAATPHQLHLARLAIYERALYVLVAAAEISFVRTLHRDNVRNKELARKNVEAFRRWRDATFGSHTPSISTLMCISAIGGHEPSYRALKITSPADLLLNAAFDAARLEELGASVQNTGRFGFSPDVAIFATMDRDLAEAFERFTLNSTRRSLDISAQTPWLHERRRNETRSWYMNLSPITQMDRLRARTALTAIESNLRTQVPGSLFLFAQALAGPRAVGQWSALQNGFANFAGLIAPALTGFLVDRTGHYLSAFVVTAAISVAGGLVWIFGVRLAPVEWAGDSGLP